MERALSVSSQRPGAYPRIRDAVEVAPDGAVISIDAGVYPESVRLDGRRLTLQAAGEPGSVTVDATDVGGPAIACTGGDVTVRGLALSAGDYPAVTARGGTLRLHTCEVSAAYGAGVVASDGATLEATAVRVVRGQHGFVFEDAGGTVDTCEIRDVTDDGIIVRLGADPTIRGTTVAACGFRGVYVYQGGRPRIERCDVSGTGDVGIAVAHQSSAAITADLGARDPRRRHQFRSRLRRADRGLPGREHRDARHPARRGCAPHRRAPTTVRRRRPAVGVTEPTSRKDTARSTSSSPSWTR